MKTNGGETMAGRLASRLLNNSVSTAVLASAMALLAGTAYAQQANSNAPVAANDQGNGVVVVTAEKRTQNLQTVPIAATVLSGADLEKKGVTTLDQLQFVVPAMSVSTSLQGNQFDIRGIGRGALDVQVPSGVQTYRDNISVFPGFFQEEPYFDISSVEVLRGPQGTFAGLNATAGAVYITETNPSFGKVGGYLTAQGGNYSDFGLQGALNLPINDSLAVRLAFNHEQHDTFFNVIPSPGFSGNPGGLDSNSARLSVLYSPNDHLQVLFKFDGSVIDVGGYPATPNPAIPNVLVGGVPAGGLSLNNYSTAVGGNACPQELADILTVCTNAHLEGQDTFGRAGLDIKYTFGNGITFRSISGYQYGLTTSKIDADATGVATAFYHSHVDEPIVSQEFNLVSPDTGRFRWVLGAYGQLDTVHIPFGGFAESGVEFFDYTTPKTNLAIFGQGTYELTPSLELQVGLRYTDYQMSLHDVLTIAGLGTFLLPASGSGNINEHDSKLTGKAALNWTIDPNNFIYGFVATGHKSGTINSTNLPFGLLNPATTRPEDITDFELGWKAKWFDGHVRTQFDGFYSLYSNFQLDLINPSDNLGYIGNAGGTTIDDGLEAQAQAIFGHLQFDFVGAYIYTKLGNYSTLDPLDIPAGVQNVTGHHLPFAPPLTFSVGAQYAFDVGNGQLTPRVDFSHTDAQWASVFEEQPPNFPFSMLLGQRNIVNAQLSYETGDWIVTAYSTNLTDQHYIDAITNGLNLRYPGAPRQFGLRLTKNF
jgi:iron complex outermembrane receptor protein